MHELKWNKGISVDEPRIDGQHKELIRIANVLIKAVSMGRDKRVVNNVISRLREYTVFHFSSEEELMEEVHYPGRGDHTQEHTRLKHEVKLYQRQLYEKQDVTPDAILEFIKGWLMGHILTYDRDLARFIHGQKADREMDKIEKQEEK